MAASVTTQWTVDALQALPGGGLDFEVVEGRRHRLPFHTASHENAIALLAHLLAAYVARHPQWECKRAPTELVVDRRTLLRPDVMVMSPATPPPDTPSPALVVEVLSPATAAVDRGAKRMQYQRVGVRELWLVDLDQQVVERWRDTADAPEIVREALVWRPEMGAQPLELFLPAFFGEVHLDD